MANPNTVTRAEESNAAMWFAIALLIILAIAAFAYFNTNLTNEQIGANQTTAPADLAPAAGSDRTVNDTTTTTEPAPQQITPVE